MVGGAEGRGIGDGDGVVSGTGASLGGITGITGVTGVGRDGTGSGLGEIGNGSGMVVGMLVGVPGVGPAASWTSRAGSLDATIGADRVGAGRLGRSIAAGLPEVIVSMRAIAVAPFDGGPRSIGRGFCTSGFGSERFSQLGSIRRQRDSLTTGCGIGVNVGALANAGGGSDGLADGIGAPVGGSVGGAIGEAVLATGTAWLTGRIGRIPEADEPPYGEGEAFATGSTGSKGRGVTAAYGDG